MSSWYVFTEEELRELPDKIELPLREHGRWTENETLLVKPDGPLAFKLTGFFDKKPRRIGPDPPVDTKVITEEVKETYKQENDEM